MATLILVSHPVNDFKTWKAGFDAHAGAREGAQLKQVFVGHDASNPNLVHIGFEAPSVAAARAFLDDPGLKAAMAAAGVTGAPDIRLVETG